VADVRPAGAGAHYTERLIKLPGIGLHYTPERMSSPLDRAALELDPAGLVYWSGQALYKYLPSYDAVFPRIAAAVGKCQFVFIFPPVPMTGATGSNGRPIAVTREPRTTEWAS